jgi:hypothetical protein
MKFTKHLFVLLPAVAFFAVLVALSFRKIDAQRRVAARIGSTAGLVPSVGSNLAGINYFSPELPFLNIVKSGSSNGIDPMLPWMTSTSAGLTWSTKEEGYVPVDSNGYPTSLTSTHGGQTFSTINLLLNYGLPKAPGTTFPYDGANTVYRLQATGNGTLKISGDASATLTIRDGGTHSTTFTVVNPNVGLILSWTAIGGGTGAQAYPINISVVNSAYAASYDAGAIFNPKFLASLAPYRLLRFMDWLNTNAQLIPVSFTGAIAPHATSATLNTAWTGNTGTYSLVIGDFSYIPSVNTTVLQATLTFGSTAVTFATAPSIALSAKAAAYIPLYGSWATRPTPSALSYSALGAPYEVAFALCKQVSVDCWINVPMGMNVFTGQSAFWTNLATLAQSTLGSSHKLYVEYSNEIWNGGFQSFNYSNIVGVTAFKSSGGGYYAAQEWMGTQVAQMADAIYAVYGSAAFNKQVIVSMGGQYQSGAPAFLIEAMNTPDWSGGAAYTHHIGAYHFAPYFSINEISNADANTILSTANPANTFFGLAYTNVLEGRTYSSLPSQGFVGSNQVWNAALVAGLSDQPWAGLPMLGYEGGSALQTTGEATSGNTAWQSLLATVHRDARFSYLYYDPTHQLSSNPGYLPWLMSQGFTSINQFNDVGTPSQFGEWGALESVQQTISPLSSAPSKYQGIALWSASVGRPGPHDHALP